MIYTALDVALVAMLAVVTVYAGVLHRELRRFRGANAEYVAVLAQTSRAVESVEGAVRGIQDDAGSVLVALGEQIDRANVLLVALKDEHRARPAETAPEPKAAPEAKIAAARPAPAKAAPARAAAKTPAATPAPAPTQAPPAPAAMPNVDAWAPAKAAFAALVRDVETAETARYPEPTAAPVRATKAHQWPTVRLASGANAA
jgi:pyruvate/2-oxoglutarate dehydrogenase complex dihydrolipoamide acyltransferase (E2) component